jgi:hypothetical protein
MHVRLGSADGESGVSRNIVPTLLCDISYTSTLYCTFCIQVIARNWPSIVSG